MSNSNEPQTSRQRRIAEAERAHQTRCLIETVILNELEESDSDQSVERTILEAEWERAKTLTVEAFDNLQALREGDGI